MTTESNILLQVKDLEAGYGKKQVLFGVSLEVRPGEIVSLIGPNGAGKSTVLKVVCGLIPAWKGEITLDGAKINGSTPAQNVARGITFAPQGNRVFDELTVRENLEIGGFQLEKKELRARMETVLSIFPALRDTMKRDAGKLSGGEQQMLALARALMPRPKLLMLDEPSLGLAPGLVKDVFTKIAEISRDTGVAILIVEQKVREVLEISNRVYSIKLGKNEFSGLPEELKGDKEKLRQLFL
jgi:branched-chain amino acid transport system ATP-binding protein